MTNNHKSVSKSFCLATPLLLTLGLSSGAQAAAYAVLSNVGKLLLIAGPATTCFQPISGSRLAFFQING